MEFLDYEGVPLATFEPQAHALPVIYHQGVGNEHFCAHATTAVSYHNKAPDFYEEVKVALPVNVTEQHHILFTFFHITCKGFSDWFFCAYCLILESRCETG